MGKMLSFIRIFEDVLNIFILHIEIKYSLSQCSIDFKN